MKSSGESSQSSSADYTWPFWPLVPLYPYGQRRTLRQEVVKDTIWTFEQVQGIFYVVVPIRMTVVKLEAGGLLVYAPIAPTQECVRLVRELEAQHGAVRHIILPTLSGLEHKVFVGPFARRFPQAQVWVAPGQWSYPLNLPLTWLGFPPGRTRPLPPDSCQVEFGDELDYALLGPIRLGLGSFGEVACLHRRSRTLVVTDTVVSVPADPPAIVTLDPYPLLFHARDQVGEMVQDSPATRRKGWQRICLFAFYFRPAAVQTIPLPEAFKAAHQSSDRSRRAYFGLFPFAWQPNWESSFTHLRRDGQLQVAPILQTLILNRASQTVLNWVDRVADWNFERIIPCHFAAPIAATPQDFRCAFTFLKPGQTSNVATLADFALLSELEETLTRRGITPPRSRI
uniref:DUF4336 domain-containing protein n=1 Tax=Cyanothece sp. (strain PCC 7425 / ATCC 29141) TaxID=395961 RepID=B8HKJ6_CYAP4